MQQLDSWLAFVDHWQSMQRTQQRHLLVLPECAATYQQLLPILIGHSSLPTIAVNCNAEQVGTEVTSIKPNQAKQMLGLNRGLLIYRAVDEFNVSAFSALCGTLVGGSFAVLIVPSDKPWQFHSDQQSLDYGCHEGHQQAFKTWWQGLWQTSEAVIELTCVAQQQACEPLLTALALQQLSPQLNQQQLLLVDQILSSAAGGDQVIWVTGPRGRGKTFAIKQALGNLQQSGHSCLLTASANHNSRMLSEVDDCFVAVDVVLANADIHADVVFIEEASSMPLYLLQQLLQRFPRLVLVSTVDGYEGTGQGLKLKLPAMLDNLGLHWQQIELHQPLRWQTDDLLEQLIETSFLPRQLATVKGSVDLSSLQVRVVQAEDLLADNDLLQQIYTLLALAHYQTTPQDIRLLLDHPQLRLHLHLDPVTGQIYGLICTMREGGIDACLAQQIANGTRRIKGQLLAQILAQQAGMASMAKASILRVQRIAVHPDIQGQGLGSAMLVQLQSWAREHHFDYVGSSFAAEPKVVHFWLKAGFKPVWGGLRPDAASGLPSLQVLSPLGANDGYFLSLCQHWYFYSLLLQHSWPQGLPEQVRPVYKGIAIEPVKQLLQQVGHEAGNCYAISPYILQWLLGLSQHGLCPIQSEWLLRYRARPIKHKAFVQLSRRLIQQYQTDIATKLDTGLLAIEVDHPRSY